MAAARDSLSVDGDVPNAARVLHLRAHVLGDHREAGRQTPEEEHRRRRQLLLAGCPRLHHLGIVEVQLQPGGHHGNGMSGRSP